MLKRAVFFAALLLVLPAVASADGVDFGFRGGSVVIQGSTLTNLPVYGGVASILEFIGRLPVGSGPQVGSGTADLGTLTFQTGSYLGGVDPYFFGAGGSFSFVSNAAFQALTGIAAGTTLFSGTFVPFATNVSPYPGVIPGVPPTGTSAVWFSMPCGTAPAGATCTRLIGSLNGTIDASLISYLGLGNTNIGNGWFSQVDLLYMSTGAIVIQRGDAQLQVPEPATLFLFGSGLAGIAGLVRRKIAA
jgi:hypothetical protein